MAGSKQPQTSFLGVGLALGVSIGVGLGLALGNLSVGIAVGLVAGLAIGAVLDAGRKKKRQGRDGGDGAPVIMADGGGRSKDPDGSDGGSDGGGD